MAHITVPVAGDGAHALLSASSAERWAVCPISVTGGGERKSSRPAAEGTLAHYISETILRGLPAPQEGDTGECEGHTFDIDESFLRDVSAYVEYVRSRPWVDGYSVEVKSNYSASLAAPYALAWGTSDCSGFEENPSAPRGRMLHVVDLKFGRNAVSPTQNLQMACYAAGVLDGMKPMLYLPGDTWVQFTIFQPRLSHRPFSWVTTVQWIESTMQSLRLPAAAAVAYANGAITPEMRGAFPENPTDNCHYCKRQRECLSFNNKVIALGQAPVIKWQPEVFQMRKAITEYLEGLEQMALDQALAGSPLLGTKLVEGRAGSPALKLPEPELRQLLTRYGVLERAVKQVEQWATPAKLRDLLKSVNVPPEVLATVVQAGEKKPVIASSDDPRAAYAPAAPSAFTAVPRPL
jgi:hypothetical protein